MRRFNPGQALSRNGGSRPNQDGTGRKYGGGPVSCPQQQLPIALYAPAFRKTFFCYGSSRR
jgi:hypothetical protein